MPQLIFKGVPKEIVKKLSIDLPDVLGDISDTPSDYFTFECLQNPYYFKGEEVEAFPMVEIQMFERSEEVEKSMAKEIQTRLINEGVKDPEVYYIYLRKDRYFE